MTKQEFLRIRIGDEVYANFSHSYRSCIVIALREGKLHVQGDAVKGGKMDRWARYQSVDTREVGMARQGRTPAL